MPIKRRADNLVRLKGPTLKSDGTVMDNAYVVTAQGGDVTMHVYVEKKEMSIAPATTRLRTDVAAGGTTFLIPHQEPAWLIAGTTVEIQTDSGEWNGMEVATFTPGTDESTPSTNFDTFTATSNPPTEPCSAGALIRLQEVVGAEPCLPVVVKNTQPARRDAYAMDAKDGTEEKCGTLDRITPVRYTEDGDLALNQESVTALVGFTGHTVPALVGGRVRVHLTANVGVTMTEYGAAATWTDTDPTSAGGGWEATIADDLAGLQAGDYLRIEMVIDAGAGQKDIITILDVVQEG